MVLNTKYGWFHHSSVALGQYGLTYHILYNFTAMQPLKPGKTAILVWNIRREWYSKSQMIYEYKNIVYCPAQPY